MSILIFFKTAYWCHQLAYKQNFDISKWQSRQKVLTNMKNLAFYSLPNCSNFQKTCWLQFHWLSDSLQCVLIFTPSYLSLSGAFTKLRNAISIFMSVCRYVLPMTELAYQLHHYNAPFQFYSSRAGFFGKPSHHLRLLPPSPYRRGSLRLLSSSKAKIAVEREEIYEWDGHTVHKLSKRRLTADSLAPGRVWLFTDGHTIHKLSLGRFTADSLAPGRVWLFTDGHTVHKLSQRRLTADWLAPGRVWLFTDGHTVHKLSQRRLTADWLAPGRVW